MTLVEPFGPRGRRLDAAGTRSRDRPVEAALARVAAEQSGEPDTGIAIDRLIGAITPAAPQRPSQLSEPVRAALHYLERNAGMRPTVAHAAAEAHLSPSRLTHLFTREVGIPFRRYGLWVRLRIAAEAVAGGADLTRAAAAAGFSDSPHLSRVFKTNFGLSPSALLAMAVDHDSWPEGAPRSDPLPARAD